MASPDHDASKDLSSGSGQEAGPLEKESTPGVEQVTQKKRGKKRGREEKDVKEGRKKKAAPTASSSERPSRERKSVVRYTATASPSMSASKAVKIQRGPGEVLKDIPNVNFKLSKRKSDESLRVLHKVLFGRKANVHFLKRNILQFSGFVWSQNEEKERSKVKEKLNKCNKDRLLDFCDLLDVYALKVTTKKEEILAKLLEFLESPHATREVILAEKDTRPKKIKKHEVKKARNKTEGHKEDSIKASALVDTNDESEDKIDAEETTEHSNSEAEEENNVHITPESTKILSDGEEIDGQKGPKSKEKSIAVRKASRIKSKKGASSSASKKKAVADDEAKVSSESKASKGNKSRSKTDKKKSTPKKDAKDNFAGKALHKKVEADSSSGVSRSSEKVKERRKSNAGTALKDKEGNKRQIEKTTSIEGKENKRKVAKTESKDVKENKKQIAKTKSKNLAKKKGKPEDVSGEPTTEQLHAVVSEILKEVDFNVATLADIIRQLGAHFNADLMHRKAEIKGILEEVINNMTDDEDDEEEDGAQD